MRNTICFKNKKIAIVGLARSGLACAKLLHELGAEVYITENSDSEAIRLNAAKLKADGIRIELGKHTRECIKGKDSVIVSPGVTNKSLPVIWAEEEGIPVISEIELGWILCPATVIAITGSSGKTTVTALIGNIIEVSGKRAFTCGNIGNPFCGEVAKIKKDDFVCLEVSSFQLERIQGFKPHIAVILNFSRNHLDRHRDMQEYLDAKKRIFMNQDKNDFLVLNGEDPVVKALAKETEAAVHYFSESKEFNPNQAAVYAVGSILGIPVDVCRRVFAEFRGLEHRFEYVAEINRVKFINDSKATVAESTIWALRNIASPVILIVGGKHKGVDYGQILTAGRQKVKEVILIGEAKEKIKAALGNVLPTDEAVDLEEAVHKAFERASPGDYVLLSPMCSSFDMFSDYEERGAVFKKAVFDLVRRAGQG